MKIRCEYCNNYIDDSDEKCKGCGAPNKNYKRVSNGVPTTIKELQEWYSAHNLPPYEVTRFFIGKDYKEPKAFGIYKDESTGKFVVYKNKDTGERKIRYEGKDEKYAVNELYLKLKEEIANQKSNNSSKHTNFSKYHPLFIMLITYIIMFLFTISIIIAGFMYIPSRGYYNINDNEYYYVNGNWYIYDDYDWRSTKKPDYDGNIRSYYDGYGYDSSSSYSDIETSDVYDESWEVSSSSSSDDWDSSSSWSSSDSWDSSSTDWGSDW